MFTAIASIAGPIIGASMSSGAAKDAAGMQAGATDRATAISDRQFQQTRSDQAPFREGGVAAMDMLRRFMGLQPGSRAPTDADVDAQYMKDREASFGSEAAQNITDWDRQIMGEQKQSIRERLQRQYDFDQEQAAKNPDPALGSLNKKFSISDFWADPVTALSYQSGLDLGTKALKNAAPLTTGLDSGAALKELTKFGTDYTGQQAAGSQSRFVGDQNNVFNRLMAMIGGGQLATQATGAAGTANAMNTGNLITAGANAGGAARIAGANAWGGAMNNISNWWNQNSMLDKVLNRGGVGGGVGVGTSGYGYNGAAPFSNYYAQD